MPFDGSGNFDRVHNFSADASAGIQAQATRFDAELDGMATGLENCQTLTGETTPTADSPMGGFKHTGVAAATSAGNYLRSDQSSNQVGIYVRDVNTGVSGIMTASAAVFPAAFTDGQRVTVKVSADGSTSAPRAIIVNGLSANIIDNEGSAAPASKMKKDGIFDLIYDSSASAFRRITPRNDIDYEIATSAEVSAGTDIEKIVTPSTLAAVTGLKRIAGASGAAGSFTTWQVLTSRATSTSQTLAVIMTTTGVGIGTWKFKYSLIMESDATNNGINYAVNHTGTVGEFVVRLSHVTSGTTAADGISDDITAAATGTSLLEGANTRTLDAKIAGGNGTAGVEVVDTPSLHTIEGIMVVTVTGSLELKMSGENGVGQSAVEIDSCLELLKIA